MSGRSTSRLATWVVSAWLLTLLSLGACGFPDRWWMSSSYGEGDGVRVEDGAFTEGTNESKALSVGVSGPITGWGLWDNREDRRPLPNPSTHHGPDWAPDAAALPTGPIVATPATPASGEPAAPDPAPKETVPDPPVDRSLLATLLSWFQSLSPWALGALVIILLGYKANVQRLASRWLPGGSGKTPEKDP